jgi:hypothetical protein
MTQTIETTIINDRYIESIGVSLIREAADSETGHAFKKIVPAMAFFCFALESKLNTYAVFVKLVVAITSLCTLSLDAILFRV